MNNHRASERVRALIAEGSSSQLGEELKSWLPADLAELISESTPEVQTKILISLSPKAAARSFEFLSLSVQRQVLGLLPSSLVAGLLNELAPDDRTAFLEELPKTAVNELLKLLSPPERTMTLKLLGYPENSIGRLMTPDYIAVEMDWTVRNVLEYIRQYGRDSETINVVYVIDDQGHLLDDLSIRELLLSSPDLQVSELTDNTFIALKATDDAETAVNAFRKHYRTALPVIDDKGFLVGIVTVDDILLQINLEDTEDIQKFGGMEALSEPYLQAPFMELMRKRLGWLAILFMGEMLTSSALAHYEAEIAKAVVLALFIPLILSSGGNSGSQVSTLVTRALALGEVKLGDWWKIMRLEVASGLFLGTALGAIGFVRVVLGAAVSPLYGPHWLLLALTVCIAVQCVVLWATLVGSLMPLVLKRFGADPATSSGPLIATMVDVTGLIIYFVVALWVLKGTLL